VRSPISTGHRGLVGVALGVAMVSVGLNPQHVVPSYDTTQGHMRGIPVGKEPHGLSVWPQPGRYSLGHAGNMR